MVCTQGGGYSIFFRIRRLGPSIYRSPPKNIRKFKHPQKMYEILATPKKSQFCTLTFKKKDPKLHRNDLKLAQFCDDPQKIHKIFIPPKNIHFSENPIKYWNSEFWTQKNGPSLRMCENIRVPPPPPPPPWGFAHAIQASCLLHWLSEFTLVVPRFRFITIIMSRGMIFPTIWHFDMCRLGRASAAPF